MVKIENLLRENIKNLSPYSSARSEYVGEEGIFLDANENSIGSTVPENLNRYPDPLQQNLKKKIAELKNVQPEEIFLGNGSDEAIDLLIRAFCNPGKDRIITLVPTYGMYKVSAAINNVEVLEVELNPDFTIDLSRLKAAYSKGAKLLFICTPNNPTGNIIDEKDIIAIVESFQGIVVVDEAYIDFAPGKSSAPLINRYSNLVILQTFSKAWGLANIRLGMAFSSKKLVQVLNNIKPPYNINGPTQRVAFYALLNEQWMASMVRTIISERELMLTALSRLKSVIKVYPSEANFLLVKFHDPGNVFQFLIKNKVIVRNRAKDKHCEGCLRITIGSHEDNKLLLEKLKAFERQNSKMDKGKLIKDNL